LVDPDASVELEPRYELASGERERLVVASGGAEAAQNGTARRARTLPRPFRRSIHIRHVDTGSDGAVEQEIAALLNPYYDMQRLGFFFTATPRHADVLLVTGPVTTSMEEHLRRTYEAMPDPRIVVAAGTDACSGGIWSGPDVLGGVDKVLPVDVYIPGDPPSPITLLHGLLLATGRALPAPSPIRERAV
jgi:Ni,Fe-hydrogenase III small subunit